MMTKRTRAHIKADKLDLELLNMVHKLIILKAETQLPSDKLMVDKAIHALNSARTVVRKDMHPKDLEATKDS